VPSFLNNPICGYQDGISIFDDAEPPEDLFDVQGSSYADDDSGVDPWGPMGEADV